MAHIDDTAVLPPMNTVTDRERGRGPVVGALIGYVVAVAIAVVLIVTAYHQAQTSTSGEHYAVFWLGMLAAVAATVFGFSHLPYRGRATGLLLVLGVLTLLPKFLLSVTRPDYFDEYGHLAHAQDMLSSGNLSVKNAFLPVVQYFPGLGLLTEGVHEVTRLSLWHSGQILVLIAHCGALLLIRAIARSLGFTEFAAFVAAIVFAANPSYLYFDSQYAYETIALPMLLVVTLCCLRARTAETDRAGWAYTAGGVVVATALVFTHHISAVMAVLLCVLIAIFVPVRIAAAGSDAATPAGPGAPLAHLKAWIVAGWTAVFGAVWILVFASSTRAYLTSGLNKGVDQFWDKLSGGGTKVTVTGTLPTDTQTSTSHTPFAGADVPGYERIIALVVPALIGLLFLYNVWSVVRAADRRREILLALPFALFAAGYFVSLPLALTSAGNEASHRAWPFAYIGVALFSVWRWGRPAAGATPIRAAAGLQAAVVSVALFVLLLGNTVAGTNVIYRFPGPAVFGSDGRFQSADLRATTSWAADNLTAGAGVVTDRFTAQQLIVSTHLALPTSTESYVYALYQTPAAPGTQLRDYLREKGFRYFILDTRITNQLPARSFFAAYRGYTESINPTALKSITDNGFIKLVHTQGVYQIYQLTP